MLCFCLGSITGQTRVNRICVKILNLLCHAGHQSLLNQQFLTEHEKSCVEPNRTIIFEQNEQK